MFDWSICYLRSQRGASLLLELCIATACLSLLFFWLTPGFSNTVSRHAKMQLMERLAQSIQLAKNEAIAKQTHMVLCGSTDGKTCTLQRNWGPYWLVGEAAVTSSLSSIQLTKIVRVYTVSLPHTLDFSDFYGGKPYYLSIQPNGQTHNNGTFTYTYFEHGKQKKTQLKVNHLLRTYQK